MWDDGKLFCFTCNKEGRKWLSRIFLVIAAFIFLIIVIFGVVQLELEGN